MKPTGKFNHFTGEEIMQTEESDINWNKDFDSMDDTEKCHILSFFGIQFLGDMNREFVKQRFNDYRKKRNK